MSEQERIAPEGFSIEDALNSYTSTPESEKPRCPECDSTVLLPLTHDNFNGADVNSGTGASENDYRCDKCGNYCTKREADQARRRYDD